MVERSGPGPRRHRDVLVARSVDAGAAQYSPHLYFLKNMSAAQIQPCQKSDFVQDGYPYCPAQRTDIIRHNMLLHTLKMDANEASAQKLQNGLKNEAPRKFPANILYRQLEFICGLYDEL